MIQLPSNTHSRSSKDSAFAINGVWRSIGNKDFMMIHDSFFSIISKDPLDKWVEVYAGPYTIDSANTFTFEVRYCAYPERIGALHTVDYLFKGDTLTMKWVKKLIDPEAGDITAQLPKAETKFVRAKR